jgi:hypothetical protein
MNTATTMGTNINMSMMRNALISIAPMLVTRIRTHMIMQRLPAPTPRAQTPLTAIPMIINLRLPALTLDAPTPLTVTPMIIRKDLALIQTALTHPTVTLIIINPLPQINWASPALSTKHQHHSIRNACLLF